MSPHRIGRHADVPWYMRHTVRVRGYTAGVAVIALLVGRQWISSAEAEMILLILAAALGIYGVESTRKNTTPDEIVEREIETMERKVENLETGQMLVIKPPAAEDYTLYGEGKDDGI